MRICGALSEDLRSAKRLVVGLSLGCRFGRKLCAAFFEPCVEFGGEAVGEVWGCRGEIVLFADVGVEIVEFEGVVVAESEEFEIMAAPSLAMVELDFQSQLLTFLFPLLSSKFLR